MPGDAIRRSKVDGKTRGGLCARRAGLPACFRLLRRSPLLWSCAVVVGAVASAKSESLAQAKSGEGGVDEGAGARLTAKETSLSLQAAMRLLPCARRGRAVVLRCGGRA